MLQHWEKQTGLGPWAGWEAWLHAGLHTLLAPWNRASWPGPICPFLWCFPCLCLQFWEFV